MAGTPFFEALAALAAFVAALFILDQHLHRPRPYKLMWAIGLLCYGLAAGAACLGSAGHWNIVEYKVWYYFGGLLTAIYLGLGSFYLLGPRRLANALATLVALITAYAALRVFLLPVSHANLVTLATDTTAQVTDVKHFAVMPSDVAAMAIALNIPGALFLFGGAAWSAWTFWRRHTPFYRLLSMALLALGAVFPSVLTGLQRLGYSSAAALGEFLGALCLLAGLLISLDVFTVFRIPFTDIVLRERKPAPAADTLSPSPIGESAGGAR